MLGLWTHDLESMEAISQDDETRRLLLRMASLSQVGHLKPLIRELEADEDLDEQTRGTITELASDPTFLAAVEDYLVRTHYFH